jgi:hypothetical protein
MEWEKFDKATEINEAIRLILDNRRDVEASLLGSISIMIRKASCSCGLKKDFDFESMKNSMLMIFMQCYDNEELNELKKEFEGI